MHNNVISLTAVKQQRANTYRQERIALLSATLAPAGVLIDPATNKWYSSKTHISKLEAQLGVYGVELPEGILWADVVRLHSELKESYGRYALALLNESMSLAEMCKHKNTTFIGYVHAIVTENTVQMASFLEKNQVVNRILNGDPAPFA